MNETELLQAFREERSEPAFAELVRRYAGLVYSVAKRRLADGSLAEDVAQMVFIRLAKTPPAVRSHAELAAWLHRTTVNVTIDTWRSESRRRNREQQAELMEPSENSVWEEITPRLDEALNRLNDDDRQALLLRFFGQKSMRETGVALGVSEDAAKMRVSRAVERLRTQLGAGAACTAAVLVTVLAERSVEAAPASLAARLGSIKLAALAGASGQAVAEASRFGLVAGGVVLTLFVAGLIYLTHSKGTSAASPIAVNLPTNSVVVAAQAPIPVSSASNTSAPAKPVRMWFNVIDAETGLGLADSRIHVASFGTGGMGESHELLTDSNGTVAIPEPDDATKNHGMNVFVVAEGHVSKAVNFQGNYFPPQYYLKLEAAATAGGLVVDEEGAPVTGVKIMLQGPGNQRNQMENLDFQTCPVTNHEDGAWSFSYLPRGFTNEIRFILKKPGYAVTETRVPVSQVNLTNLVLVIERGFTVMGQVTDSQNRPISKARVKTLNGVTSVNQSTKTDRDGNFTLAGVMAENVFGEKWIYVNPPLETNASGAVTVRAERPFFGYEQATVVTNEGIPTTVRQDVPWPDETNQPEVKLAIQAKGFAAQTIMVALTGATNTVNLILTNGNIFRGRVVDMTGRPIPNAIVRTDWNFKKQIPTQYDWSAHTDETGEFNWDSAPAEEIAYWFEADGYVPIRGMPLPADGTEHQITLQKIK